MSAGFVQAEEGEEGENLTLAKLVAIPPVEIIPHLRGFDISA